LPKRAVEIVQFEDRDEERFLRPSGMRGLELFLPERFPAMVNLVVSSVPDLLMSG
jgi:hypothetical protein